MVARRIVARSLGDHAFEQLVDAMTRGDIKPGSRLSEAQIAREFGISRGPLREAFSRLEGRGLVTRKPNIGVQAISLSKHDLIELFTVRESLEGMACRLAAREMTAKEVQKLQRIINKHGETEGIIRGVDYYQGRADADFHSCIVRGSHNDRLIKFLLEDLYYQIKIYRYQSSVKPGRTRAAYEEHRRIVDALAARDADGAERAMRLHISHARENLVWNGAN